ncbi:putative ABC transport system ATP-binding protein [Frondihabitans sp. PhB188]|uniref:ATP-binding cassette domain-containing protein n=1 Tax=Frondihabitans sp. PhB188 TaxID=2485200 RepID=UPI000FBBABC5|nr:ATP-binding cassette domain-containing protein [Frondihabitans sp. PhB188]ROQ39741.1 putative ABC transport system ATP-binding protein [Frondihabitans sp. PhB188]
MSPVTLRLDAVEIVLGPSRRIGPVTLEAGSGDLVVVTGGAGSGKSTLLEVLTGSRMPSAGHAFIDGSPPRFGEAGILAQRHELLGGLTAVENVAVRLFASAGGHRTARGRSHSTPPVVTDVERLLASLGLPPASWHNLVEQLSGGQQQRVALARALIGTPRLIVVDDPTSELDEATAELVWTAIEASAAAGALVIIATDDPLPRERASAVVTLSLGLAGHGE